MGIQQRSIVNWEHFYTVIMVVQFTVYNQLKKYSVDGYQKNVTKFDAEQKIS